MSGTTISTAVANPTRTAVQMTPAAVITELLDIFVIDLDERGYLAVFAGLTLVLSFIQNTVENRTGKGLLRKIPQADAPVVDAGGPDV